MYSTIKFEVDRRIATVRFNRPDKLNAMNAVMMDELTEVLQRVHVSPEIRVLVMTGEGRAFMSGADLESYSHEAAKEDEPLEEHARWFAGKARTMYALIEDNDKPVIAAVNGYALGGGFELVLCCDLVIAAESAKMGLPEIGLNLVPGGGGTQRLPRKIGMNRANEVLLTGRFYTAVEMERFGLVNEVAGDTERLEQAVGKLALELADKSGSALAAAKKLAQAAAYVPLSQGLDAEAAAVYRLMATEETRKKLKEFAEKARRKKERKEADHG